MDKFQRYLRVPNSSYSSVKAGKSEFLGKITRILDFQNISREQIFPNFAIFVKIREIRENLFPQKKVLAKISSRENKCL